MFFEHAKVSTATAILDDFRCHFQSRNLFVIAEPISNYVYHMICRCSAFDKLLDPLTRPERSLIFQPPVKLPNRSTVIPVAAIFAWGITHES